VAGSIGALSEVWGDLQRAAGATERLVELIQAKPELECSDQGVLESTAESQSGANTHSDAYAYVNSDSALKVDANANANANVDANIDADAEIAANVDAIAFENILFSYPSRPLERALTQLTLKIPKGQSYALVGPSGAGKTTIFSLLLRFYQPQSGSIRILGRDIKSWPLADLRNQIGIVTQEPLVFATTAMENIRYGRLDATDEEVIAAAKNAYAHDFISALPEGYQSFLGERGVRLSGGQKQRISIARAMLKNPTILLLDEATSALDAESERQVQQALNILLPGKTSLIIAHRLATILRADQIVVIDAGRIVEQGTHHQLLEKSGLYARLAKLQFSN
jgi:ATP-binding cassette subfamily B protein